MSTSVKALSKKKGRPLRKLIFLAVLAGIVVAVKNALEDKGGSYEAPAAEKPSSAPVPTPPKSPAPAGKVVTAEDIIARRPVENLDEFADPVNPAATQIDETQVEETQVDETQVDEPNKIRAVPGKIDPFGVR